MSFTDSLAKKIIYYMKKDVECDGCMSDFKIYYCAECGVKNCDMCISTQLPCNPHIFVTNVMF